MLLLYSHRIGRTIIHLGNKKKVGVDTTTVNVLIDEYATEININFDSALKFNCLTVYSPSDHLLVTRRVYSSEIRNAA